MIQMQRVQPEIKKIQQKYKDDKAKQNEELLKFYQENKINPLAGCLPMIDHDPDRHRGVPHVPHRASSTTSRTERASSPRSTAGSAATPRPCPAMLRQHHGEPAEALHFLGMSLNRQPRTACARQHRLRRLPYYVVIALRRSLTGWYQVRQTQARQLQSGNAPAQRADAGDDQDLPGLLRVHLLRPQRRRHPLLRRVELWRIGQQHLVIGKLYDQAMRPATSSRRRRSGAAPKDPRRHRRRAPPGTDGPAAGSKGADEGPARAVGERRAPTARPGSPGRRARKKKRKR